MSSAWSAFGARESSSSANPGRHAQDHWKSSSFGRALNSKCGQTHFQVQRLSPTRFHIGRNQGASLQGTSESGVHRGIGFLGFRVRKNERHYFSSRKPRSLGRWCCARDQNDRKWALAQCDRQLGADADEPMAMRIFNNHFACEDIYLSRPCPEPAPLTRVPFFFPSLFLSFSLPSRRAFQIGRAHV